MTSLYQTGRAVQTHLDTEISSDGAGGGVSRVGGSQHHTTSLDSVETLPHHRNHGAAGKRQIFSRKNHCKHHINGLQGFSGEMISKKS